GARHGLAQRRGRAVRCHRWRVHADEEAGGAGVVEGMAEWLVEPVAALGEYLEARRQPRTGSTVENDDPTSARRCRHRMQCVDEGRFGEDGRLLGIARWAEPRLHTSRYRSLRQDDEVHRITRAMSRRARAVPRTVPVTFERPMRGSYETGTSTIRQPAFAARRS